MQYAGAIRKGLSKEKKRAMKKKRASTHVVDKGEVFL